MRKIEAEDQVRYRWREKGEIEEDRGWIGMDKGGKEKGDKWR